MQGRLLNLGNGIFLAIYRSDIVPVFGFGENNILTQLGGVGTVYWRLQHWIYAKTKQYNCAVAFCCCYGFLGIFPWRTPINVVGELGFYVML